MTIHEEGLSKEDKEELMPCEVTRHGRRNEKVFREDAYNPDGPDLINPRRKAPPRPPTQPASSYMNSHDNEEPPQQTVPRQDPHAHMFRNQRKPSSESILDATVVPNPPPVAPPAAPAPQPTSRSPRPPPMGMFLNEKTGGSHTVDTSLLDSFPSPAATGPPPPPVGDYLADVEHTGADSFHVEPVVEGWNSRGIPGPPPVGMFLKEHVGEIELPDGFGSSSSPPPPPAFAQSQAAATSPAASTQQQVTPFSSPPRSGMSMMQTMKSLWQGQAPNVRRTLLVANVAIFAYQCITTSWILIGQRSTPAWPHALTGTAAISGQPLLRDWMFTPRLATWQPHRYLTAGLVHSGILHLLLNLDLMRHAPSKLERTTGSDVYGTTFWLAVVAGNCGHALWGDAVSATGAAAGVAGLYGLYAVYEGMQAKNDKPRQQQVLANVAKGLGRQLVYGLCLPRMFSNAAQLSGFFAGAAAGLMFYLATPKTPGQRNMAVWSCWLGVALYAASRPTWRTAPLLVLRSLIQPGSLTMGRARTYLKGL